jgi:hypothetical protein
MYSYHTRSTSFRLTNRCRLATRRSVMRTTVGVDREMFTYRTTCRPPIRPLLCIHSRGANHPMQRLQPVQQQIKHLTLYRSTFYVADFLRQPAMLSFKELSRVYLVICNLCYQFLGYAHRELAFSQQALDPMAEARGLRA